MTSEKTSTQTATSDNYYLEFPKVIHFLHKMKPVYFTMLLLLQSFPYVVHLGDGADVYQCYSRIRSHQTVKSATAQLTKGCIVDTSHITFDLGGMYSKKPVNAVVVDISDTSFIDSVIMVINSHTIPGGVDFAVPLRFTMKYSRISRNSKLEFGKRRYTLKLPRRSRIQILKCRLIISTEEFTSAVFDFYSLQLVAGSSLEITENVINMVYGSGTDMVLFQLPSDTEMLIHRESSFIILGNDIKINGDGEVSHQFIWRTADNAQMTVSSKSVFTCARNTINLVANNVITEFEQSLVETRFDSPIVIIDSSNYTWMSNSISMVIRGMYWKDGIDNTAYQCAWFQKQTSLTVAENSKYTWAYNNINMEIYNVKRLSQIFWETLSAVDINSGSLFIFDLNKIMMQGWDYKMVGKSEFVMMRSSESHSRAISDHSKMVWSKNCVVMGLKKEDKGMIFMGNWTITGESELMWDDNYFTTTEYIPSDGNRVTNFLWGRSGSSDRTVITINTGSRLTIKNTKVHGNDETSGAAYSKLWNSSLTTYVADIDEPPMKWSSYTAKTADASPIPTLLNSNLPQYMCSGLPNIPTQKPKIPSPVPPNDVPTGYRCYSRITSHQTVKSATAQLTNGCILDKYHITFDLGGMYSKKPVNAVVVDILNTSFIDSDIMVINSHTIPGGVDLAVPLRFTMKYSRISRNSKLEFGKRRYTLKLPRRSRIQILKCTLIISTGEFTSAVFYFYSLQLVAGSSLEITENVINMEYGSGTDMVLFQLPSDTEMLIHRESSFIILGNDIKINGDGEVSSQFIWRTADNAQMTVSSKSEFTCARNTINLVGNNVITEFEQSLVETRFDSPIVIVDSSNYTWMLNNISMVIRGIDGKDAIDNTAYQCAWFQKETSLTVAENSKYTWAYNNINMEIYNVKSLSQIFWETLSAVDINSGSLFIFDLNKIMMQGWDYKMVGKSEFVMMRSRESYSRAISDHSKMVWSKNCVVMGLKKEDKGMIFMGNWTITGESELMWDDNYFTTTEYIPSDGNRVTNFLWGRSGSSDRTVMTINTGGRLTIKNTKVHGNDETSGAAYSKLWNSSLTTYVADIDEPPMKWSSYTAKTADASPIPTLLNSNLPQYMCSGLPNIPHAKTQNT